MVFRSKLSVQGDLHVTGKVSGLDLDDEVVTLSGAHNVTGRKTFLNGVRADGVFTDLLDGVDVNHLYQSVLSKTRDQVVWDLNELIAVLNTCSLNLTSLLLVNPSVCI